MANQKKRYFLFSIIFILLSFPLFLHSPSLHYNLERDKYEWGLPVSNGGDEFAYFILMRSILEDGDVKLKNNYEKSHDPNLNYCGKNCSPKIEHHTIYQVNGKRYYWHQIFSKPDIWKTESDGTILPIPFRDKNIPQEDFEKALSVVDPPTSHPIGQSLILSAFLYPFKNSSNLESFPYLFMTLSFFLSFYLYYSSLSHFSQDKNMNIFVSTIVFIASPVMFYSYSIFSESSLLVLSVIAFYSMYNRKSRTYALLLGLSIGVGIIIKPTFILFYIPFSILFFIDKKWLDLIKSGSVVTIFILLMFLINYSLYGHHLTSPSIFKYGNIFTGSLRILFDISKGLLTFIPFAVVSFCLMYKNYIKLKRFSFVSLFILISNVLLYGSVDHWHGNWSYGPRYLVPLIPFLAVPLVYLKFNNMNKWMRISTIGILTYCFIINASGAILHTSSWNRHPLVLFKNHFRQIF